MEQYLFLVIAGGIFAFIASFGIGANDVANAFASSIGSKTLTHNQAVFIASIFEFLGAFTMGSHVTDTVRKGITKASYFSDDPEILILAMFCVIVSVSFWLLLATKYNLPVSTTHTCIGGIVGVTLAAKGVDAVNWEKVFQVIISWFISPIGSGILSSSCFLIIRSFILRKDRGIQINRTITFYPMILIITFFVNIFFIIYKGTPALGFKNTPLVIGIIVSIIGSIILSIIISIIMIPILKKKSMINNCDVELDNDVSTRACDETSNEKFDDTTEHLFTYLQVITAVFDSFAHGANDVANSIGPYAAIIAVYTAGEVSGEKVPVPIWVLALGGIGIIFGLLLYGRNIINTIGKKLVTITPSRGFSIELGSAFVVVCASKIGIPVSTTHCQVGATVGVGLCECKKTSVNWMLFLKIVFGWLITCLVSGLFSALLFSFAAYSPKINL